MAAAGNAGGGAISPIGVSFDGANDYLSRSSDLTNNSDSKTCTFSAWVYLVVTGEQQMLYSTDSGDSGFKIYLQTSRLLGIEAFDASSRALQAQNSIQIPVATWTHILVSMDMANTSNRHVYINDIADGSVTWSTYNDKTIDFTRSTHKVGFEGSARYVKGRLAGVFLDYTFRNLATASNRRLFIDEDGLYIAPPTTGIISLPLASADTATTNAGTGGNFTLSGVVATANRGPNQINCSASEFDGSNDNLTRTSLTNAASSKTQTISVNFRTDTNGHTYIFYATVSNGDQVGRLSLNNQYKLTMYLNAGLEWTLNSPVIVIGKHYSFQISFDLSDSSKRKAFLNGIDVTANINFATYNNNTIPFANVNSISVGGASQKHNGSMGEFYFSTLYTDMSSENPFFDSDTNLPKPLETVIEETSVTPVIALPLNGNNAGKNLGYGGDFTVNSGPYTGVRGGSEHIARGIIRADDTGNYIHYNGSIASSSTTGMSGMVFMKGTPDTDQLGFIYTTTGNTLELATSYNNVSKIKLQCTPDGSGNSFSREVDNYDPAIWNLIFWCADTSGNIFLYVNGQTSSATCRTGNFNLQNENNFFIGANRATDPIYGAKELSTVIFYNIHIDFSQEANRLKYVDALGFPTDIEAKIESGDIVQPLVFLDFKNTANFGVNKGSKNNFTVVTPSEFSPSSDIHY